MGRYAIRFFLINTSGSRFTVHSTRFVHGNDAFLVQRLFPYGFRCRFIFEVNASRSNVFETKILRFDRFGGTGRRTVVVGSFVRNAQLD